MLLLEQISAANDVKETNKQTKIFRNTACQAREVTTAEAPSCKDSSPVSVVKISLKAQPPDHLEPKGENVDLL